MKKRFTKLIAAALTVIVTAAAIPSAVIFANPAPNTPAESSVSITGGELGTDYTKEGDVYTITGNGTYTVSGTTQTESFVVSSNATLVLNGLNVDLGAIEAGCPIKIASPDVKLNLGAAAQPSDSNLESSVSTTKNSLAAGAGKAALQVEEGAGVTITGSDKLTLESGVAAIGPSKDGKPGTVNISENTDIIAVSSIEGGAIVAKDGAISSAIGLDFAKEQNSGAAIKIKKNNFELAFSPSLKFMSVAFTLLPGDYEVFIDDTQMSHSVDGSGDDSTVFTVAQGMSVYSTKAVVTPTTAPTTVPTVEPTAVPTAKPTVEPTAVPTAKPTVEPTTEPTTKPSVEPTTEPTAKPTVKPTAAPTAKPTVEPTTEPTTKPTVEPTTEPTTKPTVKPTAAPTAKPTIKPTTAPTAKPTVKPTAAPTAKPTVKPTAVPTAKPTAVPTAKPTVKPTAVPTVKPTEKPAVKGKIPVPGLTAWSFEHDGTEKSPKFSSYDTSLIKLEGTTKAVDIGEYTITLTIKNPDKYEWSDEAYKGAASLSYPWKIIAATAKKEISDNGVLIEEVDGAGFEPGSDLIVKKYNKEEVESLKENAEKLSKGSKLLSVFEINLMLNEESIQPKGKIKIKLPLTEAQLAMKNLHGVYIDDDGKMTLIDGAVVSKNYVFTVDHLSVYGIISLADDAPTPKPTEKPKVTATPTSSAAPTPKPGPTTGDTRDYTWLFIVAGVALAGAVVLIIIRIRKK